MPPLSFNTSKPKRATSLWTAGLVGLVLFGGVTASRASQYLFLDKPYLDWTDKVLNEADASAHTLLAGSAMEPKYRQVSAALRAQIEEVARARLFKKLKPELVAETKDQQFADTLNSFKDALNYMVQKSGKSPGVLFPSYDAWQKAEAQAVSQGLDRSRHRGAREGNGQHEQSATQPSHRELKCGASAP